MNLLDVHEFDFSQTQQKGCLFRNVVSLSY